MWIKVAINIALISGLLACIDIDDGGDRSNAQIELTQPNSDAEFKQHLVQSFLTLAPSDDRNCIECSVDAVAEATTADDAGNSEAFSGTNLQVQGVDESDVWKYDGEHFYILKPAKWNYQNDPAALCIDIPCNPKWVLSPASIRIVKNDQQPQSTIDLGDQSGSDLYLWENQLILINNGHQFYAYGRDMLDVMVEPHFSYAGSKARIRTWDVTEKNTPIDQSDIEIDGQIQRTRRIGDELFIVSRFSPQIPNLVVYPQTQEDLQANRRALDDLDAQSLLPKIRINGVEQHLVETSNCMVINTPQDYWYRMSLTTVTKLNTRTNEYSSRCVSGPVDGIHMTTENLYLYAHSYYDFEIQDDSISWNWQGGNTHIHQFALSQSNFNYMGSVLLPGLSGYGDANFRYGEMEDGSLAVVTSTNEWSDPTHRLFVLKSDGSHLNITAQLPNEQKPKAIGKPGERIYSVRFMQNRAYIVTFQKVDPLYVIDLSNPLDPRIAGELEIPGFSDYLHPVGDDLLIGVGKGALTGASGTTWFQGIKVSLFDVADMENPQQLASINIGKRGSHTALSYDHHAFTGLDVNGEYRFALPISVHQDEPNRLTTRDPESQYYQWSYSGLHLFSIDNNELSLEGVMMTEQNDGNQSWGSWNTRRGLIQGDSVYHLSGESVYKADWETPEHLVGPF